MWMRTDRQVGDRTVQRVIRSLFRSNGAGNDDSIPFIDTVPRSSETAVDTGAYDFTVTDESVLIEYC